MLDVKTHLWPSVLIGLLAFCALVSTNAAPSDLDLAYRWAPIHYQDTDSSDYDADYITAVDFDGDWDGLNNWEHQDDNISNLKAKAYYSVTETSTHWFILYSFFHPRDWVDYPDPFNLDHHENDMEGVLMAVRKDGSTYGALEGIVTVAHQDFYSYTPAGSPWRSGQENIDGTVLMQSYDGYQHPTTFQEAKGHGLNAWNGSNFPGGDGVVYYPSRSAAEVPASGNDRSVQYQLIDTFASGGLWAHRSDPLTFASWGTFRGDDGKDNAANAGWKWDDHNDGGQLLGGELATDPAKLIAIYFSNLGNFSRTYLRNLYN
ncbi:MAG TPA: hypothetical protein PKA28_08230 [Methylomusa anaerophila]|uniref:Uncharacterized protein n=1 Tax=Methylomusa anaerophila TaxID=1930071 RepID=A0A348AL99_9FIRM|nr:NPP1 family protein [Methylomusa anaerophila]BBB91847.1 hypothetical protein MAMMFC1_02532 [Methylomusa anaerophila]HML88420.1 hypothetical protein [Methylomusa anaerophila]